MWTGRVHAREREPLSAEMQNATHTRSHALGANISPLLNFALAVLVRSRSPSSSLTSSLLLLGEQRNSHEKL